MKVLDLTIVVLAQGTKMSHLFKERKGRRDVAEKGDLMESQRDLGATPGWALRTRRRTLYSMQAEIESQ